MVDLAQLLQAQLGGQPGGQPDGQPGIVAPSRSQAMQRQQMANLLLQGGQTTTNPIVAALSGFLGTRAAAQAAEEFGQIEQQEIERQRSREAAKEERENKRLGLEERRLEQAALDRSERLRIQEEQLGLSREELAERRRQFDEGLALDREQFNAKAIRDAQENAITRVKSPEGEHDLLFKGFEPVTDGLEKGMQWAIDGNGNQIAVPVPSKPNEQASNTKQIMKETVDRLLKNKDAVRSVYGPLDAVTPNLLPSTRKAATDIDQLRSILTVENLGLMSGVLSETDIKILQNVSGGQLAEGADQDQVISALEKMQKTLGGAAAPTGGFKVLGIE